MLSTNEKDYLYEIISALIGEDHSVRAYKGGFNENTISVVEDMVAANKQCNANIKELVKSLIGASGALSKGWLKKALKLSKKKISKTTFKGYGCLVSVKSRWKTSIVSSTI